MEFAAGRANVVILAPHQRDYFGSTKQEIILARDTSSEKIHMDRIDPNISTKVYHQHHLVRNRGDDTDLFPR